jgi:hypothetical protein
MGLSVGARLGVYEIGSPLGAGGMGEVYRARDPRLGREVAIKVLPAEFSADADRHRRFEQEARAAAALNHPNILAVYDIGTHDRSPYIVSELLDGQTLRERLREGPLAVRQAVEYARQLTCGLVAAHAKGIVHRNLKPDNVFVTRDGRVKILDFGLAKTRPVAGRAEPYFRRALELNPRSSLVHAYYGLFLAVAYRPDESSEQVHVALDLDPLSPFVHAVGAVAHYLGRGYPEAERLARRALDLQMDYLLALWGLGLILTCSGRVAEAIAVTERAVALSRAPKWVGVLAGAYGLAGRTADLGHLEHELEERRNRGEYVTPVSHVQFAMARRDGGMIRRALEDCLGDNSSFASLRIWCGPSLDAWRTDGAIDALLLRLGDGVRPPSRMNAGA